MQAIGNPPLREDIKVLGAFAQDSWHFHHVTLNYGVRYDIEALRTGDRVELLSAGAYTTTYASQGFNGFAPLAEHYL